MSVRKFSTASILSPSYKNSKFWDGETFPGYFESIATTLVPSTNAASVTFSNIPQNYTHLQVRVLARTTTSASGQDDLAVQINADAGESYYWHRFGGSGASTITGNSGALVNGNQLQELIARDGQGAGVYSGVVIDFLDYTNTNKRKTVRCIGGNDNNGSGAIMINSFLWNNTSAITSIAFSSASSFKANSHFALYGIRGA